MPRISLFFLFLSSIYLRPAYASDRSADAATLDLPVLVKEGAPGDSLMQDPVVPAWDGAANQGGGSGTLQRSLSDQIALPVIGTSAPGSNVQFRGLGRSAEDTDVQAFGVPLNPPQGGGFDLSIFPQFLWSAYQFQAGPALGTYDPRGTAGSLTLVPWTAQAFTGGASVGRALGFGSTANVFQVSAAASDGKSLAVVVGTSAGDAQGPSAGFSGKWRLTEREILSFHLLLTDVDAKSRGPDNQTTLAHQQTVRGIPVLQLDSRLGQDSVLKTSVFFDGEYLKYEDFAPRALPASKDHIFQAGTENALLIGDWKFGAALRGVRYQTLSFDDQSEAVVSLLVSKTLEPFHGLVIEPTLRAVGVSRYGMVPEASLGVRQALSSELGIFARVGLSRHFPSMLNRFYDYRGFSGYPGFVGNPSLQPEKDWTGTFGAEWKGRAIEGGLQAYGQFAQDAQVRAPVDAQNDAVQNLGSARTASVLGRAQLAVMPWIDLGCGFTLSVSHLSATGQAFPGQPGILAVFSAGLHSEAELAGGGHTWEAKVFERVSSVSLVNAAGILLPAFHEEDLELRARFEAAWMVIARLEDVSDQRPQLVLGYPSVGRTGSVMVGRQF